MSEAGLHFGGSGNSEKVEAGFEDVLDAFAEHVTGLSELYIFGNDAIFGVKTVESSRKILKIRNEPVGLQCLLCPRDRVFELCE